MPDFIAYYRVSTDSQGARGLGMGAQKEAIAHYVKDSKLLAEYSEVESGKKHSNRPQLAAALAECKRRKATLVIAKLDRLGRNVAFISTLMESNVEFVCCDNPHATPLLLHVLTAFAQHERTQISTRTKEALAEAKRRGVKLGNPNLQEARKRARNAIVALRPASEVLNLMKERRNANWTYRRIAGELNRLGVRPPRGKQWYASGVRNQLKETETLET